MCSNATKCVGAEDSTAVIWTEKFREGSGAMPTTSEGWDGPSQKARSLFRITKAVTSTGFLALCPCKSMEKCQGATTIGSMAVALQLWRGGSGYKLGFQCVGDGTYSLRMSAVKGISCPQEGKRRVKSIAATSLSACHAAQLP